MSRSRFFCFGFLLVAQKVRAALAKFTQEAKPTSAILASFARRPSFNNEAREVLNFPGIFIQYSQFAMLRSGSRNWLLLASVFRTGANLVSRLKPKRDTLNSYVAAGEAECRLSDIDVDRRSVSNGDRGVLGVDR